MKALILAALAAVSVALSPVAQADPASSGSIDYSKFFAAVRHDGMDASDSVLAKNGDWACSELAGGSGRGTVAQEFTQNNNVTLTQAQSFVADASTYLCDQEPSTNRPPPMQPGTVV